MRRSAVLAVLLLVALAAAATAVVVARPGDEPPQGAEGRVQLVKRTSSAFDRYTDAASPRVRSWMNDRLWRAVVFSPYFDDKTSWFHHGWAYRDLYGIAVDSPEARQHPEWILRDGRGRRLYIPFACGGGRCSQYAADPGNAAYRRHWIAGVRASLARGYAGLWIDDVNLEFRVSDGSGNAVPPVRGGRAMSAAAWRNAIADFVTEIRRAVPRAEIVHNSIWFAAPRRQADPAVQRQIRAANVINLERGVNDDGLTGGDGDWSLNAYLRFVDAVHGLGRSVVYEGVDPSDAGREYNLAAELLTANGHDAVGIYDATPDDLWAPYGFDLGAALGPRTSTEDGVLERRFTGGLVVVNPPGSPTRTVDLGGEWLDSSGHRVTQVRLGAARGAVLRRP